jgi:hypothetical protein
MPSKLFCQIFFATLFALCGMAFADTIYLKNGDKIEEATLTEITQTEIKYKIGKRTVLYTILKNDALKVVYKDGSEDVFEKQVAEINQVDNTVAKPDTSHSTLSVGYSGLGFNAFWHWNMIRYFGKDDNFLYMIGPGLGLAEKGIALSGDFQLGMKLPSTPHSAITLGLNPKFVVFGEDVLNDYEILLYTGFLYKQWLFTLGYSLCEDFYGNCSSFAFNAGHIFEFVKEKEVKEKKEQKSATRYFRPGIEINYPVWRSEIEFWDNSFPYPTAGAGLFLRIGSESFYFTTGTYIRAEDLYKEGVVTGDLSVYGINLATLPLLDLEWKRGFLEVPLYLSFGSGQIKFTGGVLLDFYLGGDINIYINEDVPLIGGESLTSVNEAAANEIIEKLLLNDGNMYCVLGLDFDIVRYWGIGVKFLIWVEGGTEYSISEPSRFQTRVSTYFVF